MPYGDQKSHKGRTRGGDNFNYDAWHRSQSKAWLDTVKYSDAPAAILRGLDNETLVRLRSETRRISRYGDHDWNRIVALLSDGEKEALAIRLQEADAEEAKRRKKGDADRKERMDQYRGEELERKKVLVDESRLVSGYLHSELATALRRREAYGLECGEWLDDPVAAITGQGGFGEEVVESVGIKLQVNLALDCSNSMVRNGLDSISINVMRTLYLALEQVAEELPEGSLVINAWLWARGEDGKGVHNMSYNWDGTRAEPTEENPLGAMRWLDGSRIWTGEDTWIYPLLQDIDEWEQKHGDFGAYRLDIILTDGVLEHKTDPRRGGDIQERRNGNLETVILNFLARSEWGDFPVPSGCVQYEATIENVGNLMRQILGDWVVRAI